MEYTTVKTPLALHVCKGCGAVVSDRPTHDEWHSEQAETAALAGTLKPIGGTTYSVDMTSGLY